MALGDGSPISPLARTLTGLMPPRPPAPTGFRQPRDVARLSPGDAQSEPLGSQLADWMQGQTGWRPGTTPSWMPQWARDLSASSTALEQGTHQRVSDLTQRVTGQPMTDEDWNALLSLGMTVGSVGGVRGPRGRPVAPKDPGAELRTGAPPAGETPTAPPMGHNLPPEPTAPETPPEASAPDVGPEGAGTPEPAAAPKSIRQHIEEAVAAQEAPIKKPGINGLTNPMPHPEDYQAGIQRGLNRSFDSGAAPPVVRLGQNEYLGNVNLAQWKQRMEGQLSPDEIVQARNWYRDALPAYERHFGEEDAPAMMGAWLIANRNVDPAGAQLNALRVAEQTSNLTPQFGAQKQGGLADAALRDYWNAIKSGDLSGLSRLGGQKIYDFIDSALGKDTRTFYGDDPRMGAPAVADVHSLRDMGHIDDPTINWVRQKYGDEAADNLTKSFGGTPSEAQYEWGADKMRRFANQMNRQNYMGGGWTPSEVQATGWMTMSKMLGRSGQTAEQAILAHTRNVSSELDFGAGAPYHEQFPDWAGLTPEQKAQVTQEVMPLAHNFARELTGAHGGEPTVGIGGWGPYTNPSMKSRLIASPEVAGDYADVLGHLAQQTEVFGYRPETNGKTLGVGVHGEGLQNPDTVRRFWSAFTAKHPDLAAGFSPSIHPDGTPGIEMLFDKGGAKMQARIDNEVAPSIDQIAQGMGLKTNIRAFKASKASRGHDWQKDPTGGEYLSRLSARYGPDLPNRLELYRREQFEPAIRQAIDRAKARGAPEGPPPEAGQEVSPTAPQSGAVSRQPSDTAKKLGIAAGGLGLGAAGMAGQSQAAERKNNMANGLRGAPPSRADILSQLNAVPDLARTNPDIPSDADVNLTSLGGSAPAASLRPLSPGQQALAAAARQHILAQMLSSQGERGDTILAHINPQEAMALKMMGGAGTRNPVTGLPEFYEADGGGGGGDTSGDGGGDTSGDAGSGGLGGGVGGDHGYGYGHASGSTNAGDPGSQGSSGGWGQDRGIFGGGGGAGAAPSSPDYGGGGFGSAMLGGNFAGALGLGPGGAGYGPSGDPLGGDPLGGGGGGGANAIVGPLAGSPIDVTDPTFSSAMKEYQNRGWLEHLGELALPGYEAEKPVPEDPASYASGTYHTDVNPAAIAGGLIGSALAGPIGGIIGGKLLGAGYHALGGPTISGASLGDMFSGGGTPSPAGLAATAAVAGRGAPGTPGSDMSGLNPNVNAAYGAPAGPYPLRMGQTRQGQKSQQQQDNMYRLARLGLLMQANRAV